MINTLNESDLHKKIKNLYSLEYSAKEEVPVENYIADLAREKKEIIEIQTGNFFHLKAKIKYFLEKKYKLTVVFPFENVKIIETKNLEKNIISKRKSPLKKNYYTCFKELIYIKDFLLNPYFCLHLLPCTVIEERLFTEKKVQSKNKSRRFLKNYIKTGKRLESSGKRLILKNKKDYAKLLLDFSEKDFTFKELSEKLKENKLTVKERELRTFIYLLEQIKVIKRTGKKGNQIIYKSTLA